MAFILRSSKYANSFLGLARRASLTFRRKKILLLDYTNIFRFNELLPRTAATACPKPLMVFSFDTDKCISHLHNNLKAGMVDLQTVKFALDSLKENGVMSPAQLMLLIKCCGSAAYKNPDYQRTEMAKEIWKTAKELRTEMDIVHYNTLLSVYIDNNYKFSPDEILSEIKNEGLEPNRVTYKYFLKAFCQQGDIHGASKMLEQIKLKKFSINEYDFCSLIQGHCEAGELDEAAKVFSVMKDRGIQPGIESYIYMLCGYAKHGDIKKMEELLDEIKKLDLRMTDSYFLNIIYTLIVNNRTEYVDAILAKMSNSSGYGKTLMQVVHRVLHKNKDEEALKLFSILSRMGYVREYVEEQVLTIVEHFLFNRSIKELINVCRRIEDEGWTKLTFSHAMKKAVLRLNLEHCLALFEAVKQQGHPIRSHYFWPLIVRYAEKGNEGIESVLKGMRSLSVPVCRNTLHTFIREKYQFGENWKNDLDSLTKNGARENQVCLLLLNNFLAKGELGKAEFFASSYGIYRPKVTTINLLVKYFSKPRPSEEERFFNLMYYLAHDFVTYNNTAVQEDDGVGEENETAIGLENFFDEVFKKLVMNCTEEVLLSLLRNAPKGKVIITPVAASTIRNYFPSVEVEEALKKLTDSNEFELNKELLSLKSSNSSMLSKSLDPTGVQNYAMKSDLRAEKLYEELGPNATLEDHLAMLYMYTKMTAFDKAFKVVEAMKLCRDNVEHLDDENYLKKRFRIILSLLQKSGDLKKIIDTYKVGVNLGLIGEEHVIPIIRMILNTYDINTALEEYSEFFGRVKHLKSFFEILQRVVPTHNTEALEKLTSTFSKATNRSTAYTALVTAYLDAGFKAKAKELLETGTFRFQQSVFIWWFKNSFLTAEKTFEEAMEVVNELNPQDRTRIYEFLLMIYEKQKDPEKMRLLWLQCQEDTVTDPFFLEHLHERLRALEGNEEVEPDVEWETSKMHWSEEREMRKISDLLKTNKYTHETLEKLLSKALPVKLARKMLLVLAAEGKTTEVILAMNKYQMWRFSAEVASEMLKNNRVKEFFELVNTQASLKKFSIIHNCFVSQQDRIMELMEKDEDFFQKFKELSLRCSEEGKHETLLVLFIKLCVYLPEKLAKAEELLERAGNSFLWNFRNYTLSNLLLSLSDEVEFYKRVLESQKMKSVFSEALDHFYERIISFYNENGDVKSALSYLEKAKQDGMEGKLSKRLINSLKKNMEDEGNTFPYPQLLQGAA